MGFLSSLTGGGGVKAAREQVANSQYNPYNLNLAGAAINYSNPRPISNREYKQILRSGGSLPQGQVSAQLSPQMQSLYNMLQGSAMGSMTGGIPGLENLLAQYGMADQGLAGLNLPQTAADGFLGASGEFLGRATSDPGFNFDQVMAERLGLSRELDRPLEERAMQGNWDSQFGRGILDSTAGGYQTEALGRALGAKDIMRQQDAFGQARGLQDAYRAQQGQDLQAAMGFGQAGSEMNMGLFGADMSRMMQRYQNALGLFGAEQTGAANQMQNALGYLSGAGSIDSYLANLMGLGSNMASQRSAANNASYGAMTQARMAQDSALGSLASGFLGSVANPIGAVLGGRAAGFMNTLGRN